MLASENHRAFEHRWLHSVRRWVNPVHLALAVFLVAIVAVNGPATTAHAGDDAKLVLVLDSSGSMAAKIGGDTKISVAKKALTKVVAGLPAAAQVGLRVYGATVFDRKDKGACSDSQLVVPIGTDNRSALRKEIGQYRPYGETPISYSLKQAAKDLGSAGQRTIVLVSDGEETCDVDPCDTAAALAKKGIDLKFDVIGLRVSGKARSQLQCIADKGNGTYYDADDAEQVEDSLDKLATRAFRPFKLTGTPVEGGSTAKSATPLTPGQYVDTFADGGQEKLYYRVHRTVPNSTIRVGVTAEAGGFVPTVFLNVDADGSACTSGSGQVANVGGTKKVISAEATSWDDTASSPCNTAADVVVNVSSFLAYLAGRPFELLVSEEPPVTTTKGLPPAESDVRWTKMSAASKTQDPPVPGSNLSDAPTIESGTYATSILTGEKQVFAVNLDWGQRLQVEALVPPRTGALARALSVSDTLDVQILASMRGPYRSLSIEDRPQQPTTMNDDAKTYRVGESTATIRYRNRTSSGDVRYASIPGPQYVVISKSRTSQQDQFLVPFTLVVKVIGTAGEGAPAYVAPATPTQTPSPTPTPSSTPTLTPASVDPSTGATAGGTTQSDQDSPGVPLQLAIGIGVGALLLGALTTGVLLARRRRGPTELG